MAEESVTFNKHPDPTAYSLYTIEYAYFKDRRIANINTNFSNLIKHVLHLYAIKINNGVLFYLHVPFYS